MSVKSLIAAPEVRERLDEIRPPIARLPSLPLLVPPRTAHYSLVGTAFDYALRFELQRRNPHAIASLWVAEGAVARIPEAADLAKLPKRQAKLLEKQGTNILEDAHEFVSAYLSSAEPDVLRLAAHALLLAKLDNVFRALALDASLFQIDPEDSRDVATLMSVVPYEKLSHPRTMLLNPGFGIFSYIVGGADADLVCGDLLVEVKTTKNLEIKPEAVRQLLVYLMLARHARAEERAFPVLRRIGIYLSRHAHLWELPIATITAHQHFADMEEWLIRFAVKTEMDPELRELWEMTQEDSRRRPKRKRAPEARRAKAKSRRRG
jgi:hypothetical protein